MNWKILIESIFSSFLSSGLRIGGILIGALVATRLSSTLIRNLIKPIAKESSKIKGEINGKIREQREKTLEGVFISFLRAVIWVIAGLMILSELGANIVPILAGTSIVGLAIGMGSTNLIRDYLAGLFILLEDQYRVGEEVSIVGTKGKVKNLNLRRTVLEDEEGAIHYIPNGQINKVSNFSRTAK